MGKANVSSIHWSEGHERHTIGVASAFKNSKALELPAILSLDD